MIEVKNWQRRSWKYGRFDLNTRELKVSKDGKRWYPGAELRTKEEVEDYARRLKR